MPPANDIKSTVEKYNLSCGTSARNSLKTINFMDFIRLHMHNDSRVDPQNLSFIERSPPNYSVFHWPNVIWLSGPVMFTLHMFALCIGGVV